MEKFVYSFLRNTYLYELLTTVESISPGVLGDQVLIGFKDSIYHPQGGGQPNDKGTIEFQQKQYQILGGTTNRETGSVLYKFQQPIPNLGIGMEVLMKIDKDTRVRNARLHSAGHLIDVAVTNLKLGWKPSKGYHFEDAPYVQYMGTMDNPVSLKGKLQQEVDKVLKESSKVQVLDYSKEQAVKKGLVDEGFKGESVRVIRMFEQECACGGTHINQVGEIEGIQITKLNKKSKNVRVSYKL